MYNNGSMSLKFFKRLNLYKNSSGTAQFNPETLEGRSYSWTFLAPVNGVLVFNEYRWSATTSAHQSAVRAVLREKGVKCIFVDAGEHSPKNFGPNTMRRLYKKAFEIGAKIELSKNKESWAHKHRVRKLEETTDSIAKLESASKSLCLSKTEINGIRQAVFDSVFEDLMARECDRQFKMLSMKLAAENLQPIQF